MEWDDDEEGILGSNHDPRARNLPAWYLAQTNPINCGPACATMALLFSGFRADGYQVLMRNASREFGLRLWYNRSFESYFRKLGIWGRIANPGVWRAGVVYTEDRPVPSTDLLILLSRYVFVGHWIVQQGGKYYCPVRGELRGTPLVRKDVWPVVVSAPKGP